MSSKEYIALKIFIAKAVLIPAAALLTAINNSNMSDDEKTFCWEYWDIHHNGGCEEIVEEEVELDFDEMTKRQIETLAREEYDVELDRRHSKATLIAQYESLKNN